VLEYLQDIRTEPCPEGEDKGFTLTFHFAENPYFSNEILKKELKCEEQTWTSAIECVEIQATEIDWKPGKNVTVEKVTKKAKGGGSKKQKAKSTEESRDSFFRLFFRSLKLGDDLPDDCADELAGMMEEFDDPDSAVEMLLSNDHEMSRMLHGYVIPYAVRWYTGEASLDDDDDDDDDEDDDDDDDDEDEDEDSDEEDESEDEPPPPAKKKGGAAPKKKAGADGGGQQKTEECKQQ